MLPWVPGHLIRTVETLCKLLKKNIYIYIVCLVTFDEFTWNLQRIIIRTFVEWCVLWSPVYTLQRYCSSHIMVQTTIKTCGLQLVPSLQSIFLRSVKIFSWHTHFILPDDHFPRHFPTRIQYSSHHACYMPSTLQPSWFYSTDNLWCCKSHKFACYVISNAFLHNPSSKSTCI